MTAVTAFAFLLLALVVGGVPLLLFRWVTR